MHQKTALMLWSSYSTRVLLRYARALRESTLSQPQRLPHIIPHNALILLAVLSPHLRRLNIRRTLVIGLRKHAHNADENLLYALDRGPPLRCRFVLVRVVAGGMQDRYADAAVLVDIRMPHIDRKPHRRRRQRIILGKFQLSGENTALERRALGPQDHGFPQEHVVFVDGARGDAFRGVGNQALVLFEEAPACG